MTVEAALVIPVLVFVLVLSLAGIGCVITQLRCSDAAAEAARLAGRGDTAAANRAVSRLAGDAKVSITVEDGDVRVLVVAAPFGALLPGVELSATSVAVLEAGRSP